MDFTEIYKSRSSLVAFSPGGQWIQAAVDNRLVVRRSDSFQITRTWLLDPSPTPSANAMQLPHTSKGKAPATASVGSGECSITHIGWSCDSEYVLAACAKQGTVHVFKMREEDWTARIDSGAEGLVKAEWAPDGRTVLCFSEWGLRVTIWSLVTGSAIYIQFPIHPDKGYAFRADGRYFALAERHKSKDTLGLYDTAESYKLVRHFPLPTSSMSSLSLSPTGNYLAVWEGPLEYKLHVVTLAGTLATTFIPESDPGIYILDSLSWSPVVTLEFSARISAGVSIWREPSNWLEATEGRGFLSYERIQGPHSIASSKGDFTKLNPKSGALQIHWNKSGTLLLVRYENTPNAVHIYDFPVPTGGFAPKLRSVLIHSKPVLHARWNPVRKGSLVLCCGTGSLYTWSDEWVSESEDEEGEDKIEMAECIGVPNKKFETRDIQWSPDGRGMVLYDKDFFCCAFEVDSEGGSDA